MTGKSDQKYVPAVVEMARIINVNIREWSVDVINEYGRKYVDIQVGAPYLHYINGEGIYVMPEVGAYVWICKPSSGMDAMPFIVAFQTPLGEEEVSYRANRPELNPGDIMMRTRDENFLILRRGGVVQVGATPAAQRMYIPVRNIIRDFCENYLMYTIAGETEWRVYRDEDSDTGDKLTEFQLRVKEKANNPGYLVKIAAGSPDGEDGDVKFKLEIFESGDKDAKAKITAELEKTGNVAIVIKGNYEATIDGDASVKIGGDMTTEVDGSTSFDSAGDFSIATDGKWSADAKGDFSLTASGNGTVKSSGTLDVDGAQINLGGSSAVSPVVKGTELGSLLTSLISMVSAFTCPVSQMITGSPKPVIAAPAVGSLSGLIETIKSTTVYTK